MTLKITKNYNLGYVRGNFNPRTSFYPNSKNELSAGNIHVEDGSFVVNVDDNFGHQGLKIFDRSPT